MSVKMPVFRCHKVRGYTFNFSYPLDTQRLVIGPLMGTGRLIQARLHLAAEHVEVKVGPESSVAAVCAGLRAIDSHFRMEVFSLSSEEEFCELKEIQQTGRAIFVSGFLRPWNELELIRIFQPFGRVEELTCFFGEASFREDQAVVVFRDLSSKTNCLAHMETRALPFSVRRFESVDLAAQRILDPASFDGTARLDPRAAAGPEAAEDASSGRKSVRPASELASPAAQALARPPHSHFRSSDELLGATLQLQLASTRQRESLGASRRRAAQPRATGPRRATGRPASTPGSPDRLWLRRQLLDHDIPGDRRRPPPHQTIDLDRWAARGDDLEKSFLSCSALSKSSPAEEADPVRPQSPAPRHAQPRTPALQPLPPPRPPAAPVPLEQHLLSPPLPAPEFAGPGLHEEAERAWLAASRASDRRLPIAYKQARISYFAFPDESPTNSQSQV